mgnify:CR=1 FL=1
MAYRPGCPVHVRKDPHMPDLDVNHAAAVHARRGGMHKKNEQ